MSFVVYWMIGLPIFVYILVQYISPNAFMDLLDRIASYILILREGDPAMMTRQGFGLVCVHVHARRRVMVSGS